MSSISGYNSSQDALRILQAQSLSGGLTLGGATEALGDDFATVESAPTLGGGDKVSISNRASELLENMGLTASGPPEGQAHHQISDPTYSPQAVRSTESIDPQTAIPIASSELFNNLAIRAQQIEAGDARTRDETAGSEAIEILGPENLDRNSQRVMEGIESAELQSLVNSPVQAYDGPDGHMEQKRGDQPGALFSIKI